MSETEEAFIRLCRLVGCHPQMDDDLDVFEAAADKISRLKQALKPFAKWAELFPELEASQPVVIASLNGECCDITVGDLREAHSTLEASNKGGK